MRGLRNAVAAAFVGVLGGCAASTGIDIHSEHDPSAQFNSLRSYAWVSRSQTPGGVQDARALLDWRVRTAVAAELSAKGYVEQPGGSADFLIDYRVVRKEKDIKSFSDYFRYRSSGGGKDITEVYVRGYQQGSLVLEVLEPRQRRLLWYATASAVINSEKQEERVRQAVNEMLQRFPPR
jgi:hypothetical protein